MDFFGDSEDDDLDGATGGSRGALKGFLGALGLSTSGLREQEEQWADGGSSSSDAGETSGSEDQFVCPELDDKNRIDGTSDCGLDFTIRAFSDAFSVSTAKAAAALLTDCDRCFEEDGSFWLPANAEPSCTVERLARAVFDFHTRTAQFDPDSSGAEWWVQVRDAGENGGIGFHWDQDEHLLETTGRSLCPQISTVTYLTDTGAPTMILEAHAPLNCEDPSELYQAKQHFSSAWLSYPSDRKHLAFDGQLLHGVPTEFAPVNCQSKRYSFLVNIWLGHRPGSAFPLTPAIRSCLSDNPVESCLAQQDPVKAHVVKATADAGRFIAQFGRDLDHQVSIGSVGQQKFGKHKMIQIVAKGDLKGRLEPALRRKKKKKRAKTKVDSDKSGNLSKKKVKKPKVVESLL